MNKNSVADASREKTCVFRQGHASIDLQSRHAKARKIEALLDFPETNTALRMLEVGVGAGGIANYFGTHSSLVCHVDAVDVRDTRQILDGYDFRLVDDARLPFDDAQYDIVISNHVIEHVGDHDDQVMHLREIHRVLKPGGLAYLAVPNRWQLIEPHYRLAFLSWLPGAWRTPYLRWSRRGVEYDCRPLTVPGVESLLRNTGFVFRQEHGEALRLTYQIEQPGSKTGNFFKRLPDSVYQKFRWLFPTLIYIIRRVSP